MPQLSHISIVGHGRVGSTVAAQLRAAGVGVTITRRGETVPSADVTWLLVPDTALPTVARQVPRGGVVLHASGASTNDVLLPHCERGSLHPLMTFPGGTPPKPPVPAAVDGSPRAREIAHQIAVVLDWEPFDVPGDRRAYHAAAVMAGNFATTLLAEAAGVLALAGVPKADAPRLLAPLALRSLENAANLGPIKALTGPIVRGDDAVIAAHRDVLHHGASTSTQAVYEALVQATRHLIAEPTDSGRD